MSLSRKIVLSLSALFFIAGLCTRFLAYNPIKSTLPQLPKKAAESEKPTVAVVKLQELVAPWAKKPHPIIQAAPVVKTEEPAVDRTSVRYIGTLTGEKGVKTYLFKIVPTNKSLPLVVGVERHGWLLTSVNAQVFTLRGPGGNYEAAR
jgi:hypothetical protein